MTLDEIDTVNLLELRFRNVAAVARMLGEVPHCDPADARRAFTEIGTVLFGISDELQAATHPDTQQLGDS